MKTVETRGSAFPNPVVDFNYTGNFCNEVRPNVFAVRAVARIIGHPTRSLVFTDGVRKPMRPDVFRVKLNPMPSISSSSIVYWQTTSADIKMSENQMTVGISSQVIDDGIQEIQSNSPNYKFKDYKEEFVKALVNITSYGIVQWSLEEVSHLPLRERLRKESMLKKFYKRNYGHLTIANQKK